VWALFADRVSVAGTFNQWNAPPSPASEGNGYWFVDISGPVGHLQFVIRHEEETLWRINSRT
jgi:1,4-alpha-glucan branching enzyme